MAVSALRPPFRVLAPITEVKEVPIQLRFNIVHRYTKNVLNIANSADPDKTMHFAASHLGLRYKCSCFEILHKCINHLPTIAYNEF